MTPHYGTLVAATTTTDVIVEKTRHPAHTRDDAVILVADGCIFAILGENGDYARCDTAYNAIQLTM
jgi:hypothetical protein